MGGDNFFLLKVVLGCSFSVWDYMFYYVVPRVSYVMLSDLMVGL